MRKGRVSEVVLTAAATSVTTSGTHPCSVLRSSRRVAVVMVVDLRKPSMSSCGRRALLGGWDGLGSERWILASGGQPPQRGVK